MDIVPISIIAALMMTDYAFTVWGVRLSKDKYSQHFKSSSYELNPIWQKAIDKPRIFNLRHLIIVIVATGYLLFASYVLPNSYNSFLTIVYGSITIPYLTIVGRHLTNILIFSYLVTNPSEISGEVFLSKRLSVKISQFNIFSSIFIFGVIYFYTYSQFILGGVIGCTLLFLVHYIWKVRAERK